MNNHDFSGTDNFFITALLAGLLSEAKLPPAGLTIDRQVN